MPRIRIPGMDRRMTRSSLPIGPIRRAGRRFGSGHRWNCPPVHSLAWLAVILVVAYGIYLWFFVRVVVGPGEVLVC